MTKPDEHPETSLFADQPEESQAKTSEQKGKQTRSGKRKVVQTSGNEEEGSGSSFNFILLIAFLFVIAVLYSTMGSDPNQEVTFDVFLDQVDAKNVESVTFFKDQNPNKIIGKWKQQDKVPVPQGSKIEVMDKEFKTFFDSFLVKSDLIDKLREAGVKPIDVKDTSTSLWMNILLMILPFLLVIGLFFLIMRRSGDPMGTGSFGNFIRSPARQFRPSDMVVTYEDVAGMQQVKQELQEIVDFLKNPEKYHKLGAHVPKGVLLMGSPGTGKTLLAKATAGEADVPFFSANGSEFIQMFVGVGASRVRDLFRVAKDNAPCLIFIDEIDAVGRVRGAGMGGGHDEREQTLNQILSEMDGFQSNDTVIVIAATNRPDVLDRALTRPGRFDRHVMVDLPTKEGREAILKVHSRKVPLDEDVDLSKVASVTIGYAGADLKNLVNEAALSAARENQKVVKAANFNIALDRIELGISREEKLTEREKKMTAYHEAGHALLAWYQPTVDPVHKVTIIPRGRALGVTQLRPVEERMSVGEGRLYAQLIMMLGGRAAEKLIFDEYTAGAQDDLKRATDLARRMVAYWGMSEEIGPVAFHHAHDDPFLGRDYQDQRDYSDTTASKVDLEIQRILKESSAEATRMLVNYRSKLDELTARLLEKEELVQDEIEAILGVRQVVDSQSEKKDETK